MTKNSDLMESAEDRAFREEVQTFLSATFNDEMRALAGAGPSSAAGIREHYRTYERWLQAHPSVTLCPLTSSVVEAPLVRIAVAPSPRNGLRKPSQLMVDKLFSVPIQALRAVVGQLEPQVLIELDLALRGWLDLP